MRACADAGVVSVAVYADSDREALHVSLADEAYALNGARAADTYLDAAKIIEVARRCAADALHPGYGFLAENAGFARAVLAAGLIWIGPPPDAIDALGDKVSARHIAQRVGAPLVPGTPEPVDDVAQVRTFVAEHGLPIAIKAAFGGGGRGLKVVNAHDQVEAMFESAVREATAAFGRGECFVERYLDSPRHVETQCLADAHGGVVVVSTRDCSLQRRHQKLVEEAPAPFLTAEQERVMRDSSIAILRAAGYVGAGTCEFLVGSDGTVSFLEVNTRLQVEHPVSEEVTGVDLVREQLRIAAGEPLGYTEVAGRGHSLEFRINGEDVSAGFLPSPGRITRLRFPAGPGVRVDSGVVEGDTVSGTFDSMIAKIIVTGATRTQALERARRALAETDIGGIPTVLPFHRAVLDDPAFAPSDPTPPSTVHTRWIETEFAHRLAGLGANAGSSRTARWNGRTVGMPPMSVSARARRARASACVRVAPVTMIFAIIESKVPETVSPSTTPLSTRTPGPEGKRSRVIRPGHGRNPAGTSSPLIRNSIECPRPATSVYPSGSPAAIRSCSRTRSTPVISSETGCSTCRRVLTSRKETVPSEPTRNSHVPAPT